MHDLFNKYEDIALNFTVFSLFPLNSKIDVINNATVAVNKLQYALAADALRLVTSAAHRVYNVDKAKYHTVITTTAGKKALMAAIREASHFIIIIIIIIIITIYNIAVNSKGEALNPYQEITDLPNEQFLSF